MRWFLQIFKSRGFLISLGVIAVVALWVTTTVWFAWSTTTLLIGLVVILLVCVVALLLHVLRAQRSSDAIEQSIRQQAEQQRMTAGPDRRAEIEQLQERLEASIKQLKDSRLGGRGGRAALYALPWYLFVGPPGAGKTTAIANSGLNFPMGVDRVRGVGGTRDCDWFFSDEAILLDTAGRYMTEEQDTEEWTTFLETLKKHRPARPINGVIVGISISELAEASAEQVEWHAANIRRRIDELIKQLGVRFPVYLVFTKCDLLQGFTEFFGELTRQERQQIWGASLPVGEGRDPGAAFEAEYEQLVEALINQRTTRLGRSMKREDRRRVYVFPLEVAAVKENLRSFVHQLFQPNPYQETPVFRGFYLTSGTQEGAPIDRVIQAIADKFGLPTGRAEAAPSPLEAKSYFIKDVFTDVIVPDRYLVQRTSKAATRARLMQFGTAAAAVALLALFMVGTTLALLSSRSHLQGVEQAALAAADVSWDGRPQPADLERMQALGAEVSLLNRRDGRPPLRHLGLYRGGDVLGPARALYERKMQAFAEAYPLQALRDSMRQATTRRLLPSEGREALYERLRAYLLLSNEHERLADETNRAFLARVLTEHGIAGLAAGPGTELHTGVEGLVDAYVQALDEGTLAPQEADDLLIRRSRNLIYEQPSIASAYQRIRQEGLDALRPFTLVDALEGRYIGLFQGEPEVSGFFTQEGWARYVLDRIVEESEDPTADDWVMGRTEDELPAAMLDSESMMLELMQLYFNDYASAWQRFLQQVRYRPFLDLVDAARGLEQISNPSDSPVLWLLAQVTSQTTFPEEGGLNAGELAEQASGVRGLLSGAPRRALDRASRMRGRGDDGEAEAVHPVEQRFTALHDLRAPEAVTGGASANLMQALAGLANVSSLLNDAAADDAQAAEIAARVLDGNGGDLARELRSIQNALVRLDGDTRRTLFEQPIRMAWASVMAAAQRHLDRQWTDEVYRPYQQTLAGQYPLDINSTVDTPIQDFESFFRPGDGVISRFVEERLDPFLTGGAIGTPRRWEGQGLQVSSSVQRTVEAADRIGQALYTGGALRLDFELQPELPDTEPGAPAVGQVTLAVHGRESSYNMGSNRPWVDYAWPGRAGARLSVSTRTGGLSPKQATGDWAFFRLLQEATVRGQGAAQYEVRWPMAQGVTVRYNLRARSSTNPFGDPRGFFTLQVPETLR
ncbi:MAG: type VI secretion system membrane subunit TssM [Bacteroidetes bacterium]|jgi:type VI secretion system protein ImpL|nr:type VI secretion system membrane subunit TssM [Bacteroidota bacterium]